MVRGDGRLFWRVLTRRVAFAWVFSVIAGIVISYPPQATTDSVVVLERAAPTEQPAEPQPQGQMSSFYTLTPAAPDATH